MAIAQAPAIVRRYLDAIVKRDWELLASVLAADVVREGPYGDNFEGREPYVAFLRDTFAKLDGYEMNVARLWGTDDLACAELTETVMVGGKTLRTDEAIVFEVAGETITRVRVFLQKSH